MSVFVDGNGVDGKAELSAAANRTNAIAGALAKGEDLQSAMDAHGISLRQLANDCVMWHASFWTIMKSRLDQMDKQAREGDGFRSKPNRAKQRRKPRRKPRVR